MKMKLADISEKISKGSTPRGKVNYSKNEDNYFLRVTDMVDLANVFNSEFTLSDEDINKNKMKIWPVNTVLVSIEGTVGKISILKKEMSFNQAVAGIIPNEDIINPRYLMYYLRTTPVFSGILKGTIMPALRLGDLADIEIEVPDMETQNKMVSIVDSITNKIDLNNEINNNLEEQLRLFFEEEILKKLNNENTYECSLYDQFDVIDNRGKTPPLVEYSKYPIIDVKVLSGTERVINYNNCLKYVSKETYDTFFRSGHPKLYDTLLSTVGSLAELKIYLENIGTIAQNVVALRPKNDYPLFMYQYILSLKQRLTSYDIGSVQPSIKVTQFMKEIIKIPKDKDLIYKFENLANANTFKMKNLMMENRYLEQLRDTLLPKLMNGEIDLDNIEI